MSGQYLSFSAPGTFRAQEELWELQRDLEIARYELRNARDNFGIDTPEEQVAFEAVMRIEGRIAGLTRR